MNFKHLFWYFCTLSLHSHFHVGLFPVYVGCMVSVFLLVSLVIYFVHLCLFSALFIYSHMFQFSFCLCTFMQSCYGLDLFFCIVVFLIFLHYH